MINREEAASFLLFLLYSCPISSEKKGIKKSRTLTQL